MQPGWSQATCYNAKLRTHLDRVGAWESCVVSGVFCAHTPLNNSDTYACQLSYATLPCEPEGLLFSANFCHSLDKCTDASDGSRRTRVRSLSSKSSAKLYEYHHNCSASPQLLLPVIKFIKKYLATYPSDGLWLNITSCLYPKSRSLFTKGIIFNSRSSQMIHCWTWSCLKIWNFPKRYQEIARILSS